LATYQRIPQLDGWRGISILFVVAGHLIDLRYGANPDIDLPSLAGVFAAWGVDIFFVISGFIITKLALFEFDETESFSIFKFYIRRFFRIIPPLFVYLAFIGLATGFSLIEQAQNGTLMAALFVCNFPYMKCGWFAGHTWTLAYEEQFYIIFPLLFALAGRLARRFFLILLIALMVLQPLRFLLHLGDGWRLTASFAPPFSFICAGAVVAAYEKTVERLSNGPYAQFATYGAGALLLALLSMNSTFAFPLGSPFYHLQRLLGNILLPACFAWLIGSTVHQSNWLTSILRAPPLLFFGMISYSLYLWQQAFSAAPHLYILSGPFVFPPLMILVATASYYFVERPSVQLGKRLIAIIPRSRRKAAA